MLYGLGSTGAIVVGLTTLFWAARAVLRMRAARAAAAEGARPPQQPQGGAAALPHQSLAPPPQGGERAPHRMYENPLLAMRAGPPPTVARHERAPAAAARILHSARATD
jgi:hypothetical protein